MTNEDRRQRTAIYMRAAAWISFLVTVPRTIGVADRPRVVRLPGIPAPAMESLQEYLEVYHRDVLNRARDEDGMLRSLEERYYYLWLASVLVPPKRVELPK
jgi:hypothetical protein